MGTGFIRIKDTVCEVLTNDGFSPKNILDCIDELNIPLPTYGSSNGKYHELWNIVHQ